MRGPIQYLFLPQGTDTGSVYGIGLTCLDNLRLECGVIEPVRGSASWTRSGSPKDALSALESYARTRKVRIKKSDNQMTLFFGNKLIARFIGAATTRIPYTVRISAAEGPDSATRLTAEAYSDPGPFIIARPESSTRIYEGYITETLSDLKQL